MNLPKPVAPESPQVILPYNLDIEQALLGALLHNNQLFERISDFLLPEHFYDPVHQKIFEALRVFIQKGCLANPLTLKNYFEDETQSGTQGGAQYLVELGQHIISLANTETYGRQIHDLFLRRELIMMGEETIQSAKTHLLEETAIEQIEGAERRLFDLAQLGQQERGFQPFIQALGDAIGSAEQAFKRDSHVVGVTTGLLDLDKQLGGLHPSDLVIIAGRPSMGKTALATNLAFNASHAFLKGDQGGGAKVAFFSLEMSAEQLALRLLGQETGIPSDKIRRGAISQNDFPKFMEASQRLSQLPLFIDDTPGLSINALRTRARRLHRKENIGMIVIDYLQLLTSGKKNPESRVQEISEITRHLKTLAKELNVPVIAPAQLSRAVEQREDKRPILADLRESGSIEQDADVVMFIYRDEYYVSRQKPTEGSENMLDWQEKMGSVHNKADILIAKQRHGPIGNITLHFDSFLTKFSNFTVRSDEKNS